MFALLLLQIVFEGKHNDGGFSGENFLASSLGFPDFQTLSVISTVGSKVHEKEEQESTNLDPPGVQQATGQSCKRLCKRPLLHAMCTNRINRVIQNQQSCNTDYRRWLTPAGFTNLGRPSKQDEKNEKSDVDSDAGCCWKLLLVPSLEKSDIVSDAGCGWKLLLVPSLA